MINYINFSNSQTDKVTDLFNKLNKLKQVVNDPEEYIWNHFEKMKNEIDLEFKTILQDKDDEMHEKKEMNNIWINMIEKIDKFKEECLQKICNNSIRSNLKNYLEEIHELEYELAIEIRKKSIFDIFTNEKNEKLNNFEQLIVTKKYKINEKLFSNKTVLYMNKDECQKFKPLNESFEPNFFTMQDSIGRLLIVHDFYVDINYIYSFKK